MKRITISFVITALLLLLPSFAYAGLGVGIGTGKIVVDEKLRSGVIYNLPSLTVVNTGDEESDYSVSVAYHTDQPELRPVKDWFMFSPEVFHLKPGESQIVEVKLNLPLKTEPGSYFAYLEGSPVSNSEDGKSSVGIAAAAKLYFDIIPSNIFEAIYFRVISFYKVYAPWPQYVSIGIGVLVAGLLLKKFLNIEISLKKHKEI
jgi:P pilus assembly chaperone PapD